MKAPLHVRDLVGDPMAPWVEIDHEAIAHNVRTLRRRLASGVRLLVAVKANAYGHGAVEIAETVLAHGADVLGVVRVDEGIALRQGGITAPILLFGPTAPTSICDAFMHRLVPSVGSAREAIALAEALPQSRRLGVHLKLDTGMGRLGAYAQHDTTDFVAGAERIEQVIADEASAMTIHSQVVLAGVYTHFSSADAEDRAQTERQFSAFHAALRGIRSRGIDPGIRHAANSAGILQHPQSHLDMVRAGIAVYGLPPIAQSHTGVELRQAMSLKARIAALRHLPSGACVGYGETFRARNSCLVATIPIGYADGFDRQHSNNAEMLVGGIRVPVVGRICMDFTMVDVSRVPGVAVGDEVVVYGRQGDEDISIDAVARRLGTISHEVTTSVAARVRRVHVGATAPGGGVYRLSANRIAGGEMLAQPA